MVLIAVLIVLGLQYGFGVVSQTFFQSGMSSLWQKISQLGGNPEAGGGWAGVSQFVVLPALVVGVIFLIVDHLLGSIGYFVLATAWLWFCLDLPSRHASSAKGSTHPGVLDLTSALCRIFVPIFWFALFGPVGLALAVFSSVAVAQLPQEPQEDLVYPGLLRAIDAILAWLPMRLFALSCALVGQFAEVFRFLLKHWRQGLAKQAEFVQGLVVTVLPDGAKGDALTALVMRNFWVWLVVIALVSVGLLF
jgi:hypothetical protein